MSRLARAWPVVVLVALCLGGAVASAVRAESSVGQAYQAEAILAYKMSDQDPALAARRGFRLREYLHGTRHTMDAVLAPRVARRVRLTPQAVRDRTTILEQRWGIVIVQARGRSRGASTALANATTGAFVRLRAAEIKAGKGGEPASVKSPATPAAAEPRDPSFQFWLSAIVLLAVAVVIAVAGVRLRGAAKGEDSELRKPGLAVALAAALVVLSLEGAALAEGSLRRWLVVVALAGLLGLAPLLFRVRVVSALAVALAIFAAYFLARAIYMQPDRSEFFYPPYTDVGSGPFVFAMAVALVAVASFLAGYGLRLGRRLAAWLPRCSVDRERLDLRWPLLLFAAIAVVGFLGLYGSPLEFVRDSDFSTLRRTAGYGRGIFDLALHFAPAALLCYFALRAPKLHWLFYPAVLAVAAITVLGAGRLGLAFLFLPLLLIWHLAIKPIKPAVAVAAVLAAVLAFGAIGLARGQSSETAAPLAPFENLVRHSFTGVDGVGFTTSVYPAESPPEYGSDLPAVLLRFVPRSLYPDKPEFLAERLSREFVQVRGGISYILSPPGWLWATALWAGVVLGMAGLGIIARTIDRYFRGHTASGPAALAFSLALLVFAHYMANGDPSVFFFAIQWTLPMPLFFWLAARRLVLRRADRVRPLGTGPS